MLFDLPKEQSSIIKVIGIGGGGCNAVNHMFRQGIKDVNFVICNTDAQALESSPVPNRIQLGPELTKGRGAGAHPEKGQAATLESVKEIKELMERNTEMVFITAGMGGGTGTGGAPVVARIARDLGILTVAIVTLPFSFEGKKRVQQAYKGIEELKDQVDSIIVIVNDKIREVFGDLVFSEAFARADDVLTTAAKGIAEIITIPGYVNVDFEDVKTVLRQSGVAIMGTGLASGDNRAIDAVEAALSSPLLNDTNIIGARHVLLNITSGKKEVTMDEISEITEYVQEAAGMDSDIIWGNCMDDTLNDELSVTVIATGFESHERFLQGESKKEVRKVLPLEEKKEEKVAPAVAPKPTEPHISAGSNSGAKVIDPFARAQETKATEPDAVVLPFASPQDLELDGEREKPLRPSAEFSDRETVGKAPVFTPLNDALEAVEEDPAQMILPFTADPSVSNPPPFVATQLDEEPVATQKPVGLDDDDMDWSDEEEDDDIEWSDDEDDEFAEGDEDDDFEDTHQGKSLIWKLDPQQTVKAQSDSAPKNEPADQRNLPQPKPGLRLSRTVYPDGELAKPPVPPSAPPRNPESEELPAKHRPAARKEQPPVPRPAQPQADQNALRNEEQERELERQEMIRRGEERRKRLRMMSIRPNPNLDEMEAMPAYLRRNVSLSDVPHSSEVSISKLHLGDSEEGFIPKPNSYLYDNVD